MKNFFNSVVILFVIFNNVCTNFGQLLSTQRKFADYFKDCNRKSSDFDNCITDALNEVRVFFKTGVPEYNIPPFDPFWTNEIVQVRGGSNFNYRLKLKNVTESGWATSQVTRFRSDFTKNLIQYTQSFPDRKYLQGDYEFVGTMLGRKMFNKGKWNLTMYDLIQTTTITRRPERSNNGTMDYNTPLKVHVNVQSIKKLELHISNLARGIRFIESMVDRIINNTWEPGFVVTRSLVNDLVSTAFTEIMNRSLKDLDINSIIP